MEELIRETRETEMSDCSAAVFYVRLVSQACLSAHRIESELVPEFPYCVLFLYTPRGMPPEGSLFSKFNKAALPMGSCLTAGETLGLHF